jgi:hypothetical protein
VHLDQETVKISAAGHGIEIRLGAEQLRFAHVRPGRLQDGGEPRLLNQSPLRTDWRKFTQRR